MEHENNFPVTRIVDTIVYRYTKYPHKKKIIDNCKINQQQKLRSKLTDFLMIFFVGKIKLISKHGM